MDHVSCLVALIKLCFGRPVTDPNSCTTEISCNFLSQFVKSTPISATLRAVSNACCLLPRHNMALAKIAVEVKVPVHTMTFILESFSWLCSLYIQQVLCLYR